MRCAHRAHTAETTKHKTADRATSDRLTECLNGWLVGWPTAWLPHWLGGLFLVCCSYCWLFTYTCRYARLCVRLYVFWRTTALLKRPNCAERKKKRCFFINNLCGCVLVEHAERLYRHLLASSNSYNQWLTTAPKAAESEPTACCAVANKSSARVERRSGPECQRARKSAAERQSNFKNPQVSAV